MDCRLELIAVPVSDVDRAIAFYRDQVGFNLDYDHKVSPELRFVQLTPKGSACSLAIVGVTPAGPAAWSVCRSSSTTQPLPARPRRARRRRQRGRDVPVGRSTFFADPDGNRWAVQEIIQPSWANATGAS
jgi:catechol 2,3-dioxygenase-like lactoylglutathione lyase family enzyme